MGDVVQGEKEVRPVLGGAGVYPKQFKVLVLLLAIVIAHDPFRLAR